jgi:hypothetical protein
VIGDWPARGEAVNGRMLSSAHRPTATIREQCTSCNGWENVHTHRRHRRFFFCCVVLPSTAKTHRTTHSDARTHTTASAKQHVPTARTTNDMYQNEYFTRNGLLPLMSGDQTQRLTVAQSGQLSRICT